MIYSSIFLLYCAQKNLLNIEPSVFVFISWCLHDGNYMLLSAADLKISLHSSGVSLASPHRFPLRSYTENSILASSLPVSNSRPSKRSRNQSGFGYPAYSVTMSDSLAACSLVSSRGVTSG